MIECREVEELWITQLDEEGDERLSQAERRAFEEHVAACEACRARIGADTTILRTYAELADEVPSPSSVAELLDGVGGDASVVPGRPGRLRLMAFVAAAGVLLLGGLAWLLLAPPRLDRLDFEGCMDVAGDALESGDLASARQAYLAASEKAAGPKETYLAFEGMTMTLALLGEGALALERTEVLQDLASDDETRERAARVRAELLRDANRWDEAITVLADLAERQPDTAPRMEQFILLLRQEQQEYEGTFELLQGLGYVGD